MGPGGSLYFDVIGTSKLVPFRKIPCLPLVFPSSHQSTFNNFAYLLISTNMSTVEKKK